ncbi:MAG: hypothetical protein AB7S38_00965 [Vulcanimicrobiota bacterium]
MRIVSDAGPIIGYARTGYLHLLQGIFGEVLIPEQVEREILAGGDRPGAREIREFDWIRTVAINNQRTFESCRAHLGSGESAAIALAEELQLPLLLEDGAGRRTARTFKVPVVIGTKTVAEEALHQQLIPRASDLLEALRFQRYRLSKAVVNEILTQVAQPH